MVTRAEAIKAAGKINALMREELYNDPVDVLVEKAYTPTGPSKEELRRRILDVRRGVRDRKAS